jgi:serine/threonine protein kinase
MQVKVNGKKFDLDENNTASGGEGTVYFNSDLAFKIYHKKTNIIPTGKFKELSKISNKFVVKPLDLIQDMKGNIIGYTMNQIKDTVALSRVVTTDYQKQNNISTADILNIIAKMRTSLQSIHDTNCLVVDINDSNILVDKKLDVYFIDVDSYQTGGYPATAIQEYAKDFTVKENKFTSMSDWYSFSLLCVKLFVGIHPHKGRWNKYAKRDKENNIKERSLGNVSIFNKDVVCPKSVRTLSLIPQNYYDWFVNLFEKGERLLPPFYFSKTGYTSKEILLRSTAKLNISKLLELPNTITYALNGFRKEIFNTVGGVYFESKTTPLTTGEKAFIFHNDIPFIVKENNGLIETYDLDSEQVEKYPHLYGSRVFSFNNIVYALNSDKLNILEFLDLGKPKLFIGKTFFVNNNQMDLYNGLIVQKLMNKSFVYILGIRDMLPSIKMKDLDNMDVVNAKYENRLLMIASKRKFGDYKISIFKFNEYFSEYKLVDTYNSDSADLNFTVNDKGVAVLITEDKEIKILFNSFLNDAINKISDDQIRMDMHLYSKDNTVCFYNGRSVYSISLI